MSLSGNWVGIWMTWGNSMMFSIIRCLLGSSMKGDPMSEPAVFSTMMRISCSMDKVEASPI